MGGTMTTEQNPEENRPETNPRPPAAPQPTQQQQPYPAPGAAPQGYPQQAYAAPGYQQQHGYPAPGYVQGYPEQKSKLVAGLLGIFLGGLGIHRFYLGNTKIGLIQLLLTVLVGWFTFGLVGLWGFIEGIMILCGAQMFRTDARGIPLRES